jgi:hypothetical protein
MADETETGSTRTPDGGGHSQSRRGISSPLQTRAAFVKNWDWQSVVSINRGACERSRAQHGINSEAGSASAQEWETLRSRVLTLAETLDQLRRFHRKAPFLFFNGNTFATIGRELAFALFSDLVPGRKREVGSAVAHYIAGDRACNAQSESLFRMRDDNAASAAVAIFDGAPFCETKEKPCCSSNLSTSRTQPFRHSPSPHPRGESKLSLGL